LLCISCGMCAEKRSKRRDHGNGQNDQIFHGVVYLSGIIVRIIRITSIPSN